ncbi:hypothetical protein ACFE04_014588 [Oxalis oulophora]
MARSQIVWSKAIANYSLNFLMNPNPKPISKFSLFPRKCSLGAKITITNYMSDYQQAFSKRMALAGLKPHHHIALGVSGGPDSMALCVLVANWKREGLAESDNGRGFVDGLLAVIVDHGLRKESGEEAGIVSDRVSQMGIRSEIAHCDWSDGRPQLSHIQEAARDMRYKVFQDICIKHGIGVLLIAHHSDDQAELFIMRLSRNSGVLGLAGMAFVTQIFPPVSQSYDDGLMNPGILLVRPLMDFSKDDMYQICQMSNRDWVEDPTNQNPSFLRNRIRMSLGQLSSCNFKYELQALISVCRKTRSFVDQICSKIINQAVTVKNEGYLVIDLEVLNSWKTEDICMSKFITSILQFVSQRHRPVRGSTMKLVLEYIHTYPCKTSLTAAGCYLCPAPGSKGTKALVCCSVNCAIPSKEKLFRTLSSESRKHCIINDLEQVIVNGRSNTDKLAANISKVHFLNTDSESLLDEAKRLNILSEPTYRDILSLQKEEKENFKPKLEISSENELKDRDDLANKFLSVPLQPGQIGYFMNRYLVKWKPSNEITSDEFSQHQFSSCVVAPDMIVKVRHMMESDWLNLAKLSKCSTFEKFEERGAFSCDDTNQLMNKTNTCFDYARLSAERAFALLKNIPVAARRSLPVFVNNQGTLLSIPSIDFKRCPYLFVSAEFKPRVPLGGGHSSFL